MNATLQFLPLYPIIPNQIFGLSIVWPGKPFLCHCQCCVPQTHSNYEFLARMKKSTTMGATDQVKVNKRPSKSSVSFARFFNSRSKDHDSLKVGHSDIPSSSMSASSNSLLGKRSPTPLTAHTSNMSIHSGAHSVLESATGSAKPSFYAPTPQERAKSIVMMRNKPVAVFMRSEKEKGVVEEDNPLKNFLQKPKPEPAPATVIKYRKLASLLKLQEKTGLRTFRVWTPAHNRKSILVNVSDRKSQAQASEIFNTNQIRAKTYNEWKREAKAVLPSNTGGPPVELTDAINAVPMLQRETDPRAIQRAIKRMSIDSSGRPLPPKTSVSVDYTKFREVRWGDTSSSEEKQTTSGETILDLNMEDESDTSTDEKEEARRMSEWERKQAGMDIKGKIESLRMLSDNLSNKRKGRHSLLKMATGTTVLDAEEIPLKEHILYLIEMMGDVFHDIFSFCIIWERDIRIINGKYGLVVTSYFTWLREMIGLEVLLLIIAVATIIIPQIVEQWHMSMQDKSSRHWFHISDLVTGEGYFHHSYLYYTGYDPRNENSPYPFKNPAFRFLFCIFLSFSVVTYFVFSRLTKYYQTNRMESTVSGVANMQHFKTIMCAWDFSCHDPQAKVYLQKTICREMKILARASQQPETTLIHIEAEHKKVLSYAMKKLGAFWGTWAIHIAGNLLIIVSCVILGEILVQLCELKLQYYLKCIKNRDDNIPRMLDDPVLCPGGDEYLYTWIMSLPAVFASIIGLLLTKFMLIVGDYESWDTPERKIYATMIRAGLFYFTKIGVFYTFWLLAKPALNKEGFVAETIFGKELYRLVVIQGLMDVILNLGVKGTYHLIRRKSKNYQMSEFRSDYSCLSIFFMHSVSRIGVLFCPPIGVFVIIRLIVDFYQNKFSLFKLSSQANYSVHVSHVYAPFLFTFFILCKSFPTFGTSFLYSSFLNAFYLADTIPSNYDGPFKIYNVSYDEVLVHILSSQQNLKWISDLAQPGFMVTLLAILCGLLHLCRQWAITYIPLIAQLNELIVLERGDRDLLLKAIFEIGQVTKEDIGDGDSSHRRKIRRTVPEKAGAQTSETETDWEEEEEDKTDQHIQELIHHVQRRKAVGRNGIHLHSLTLHKGTRRGSGESKSADTVPGNLNEKKHHKEHMEAIVARIVDARKKGHNPSLTVSNSDGVTEEGESRISVPDIKRHHSSGHHSLLDSLSGHHKQHSTGRQPQSLLGQQLTGVQEGQLLEQQQQMLHRLSSSNRDHQSSEQHQLHPLRQQQHPSTQQHQKLHPLGYQQHRTTPQHQKLHPLGSQQHHSTQQHQKLHPLGYQQHHSSQQQQQRNSSEKHQQQRLSSEQQQQQRLSSEQQQQERPSSEQQQQRHSSEQQQQERPSSEQQHDSAEPQPHNKPVDQQHLSPEEQQQRLHPINHHQYLSTEARLHPHSVSHQHHSTEQQKHQLHPPHTLGHSTEQLHHSHHSAEQQHHQHQHHPPGHHHLHPHPHLSEAKQKQLVSQLLKELEETVAHPSTDTLHHSKSRDGDPDGKGNQNAKSEG